MRILFKTLPLLIMLLVGHVWDLHAQTADVIKASGATNISVDLFNKDNPTAPLGYVSITGPSIRETQSGQLTAGGTIVLTLPSAYRWNTAVTPVITVTPTGTANTKLTAEFTSIDTQNVTFTILTESVTSGAGLGPARVDITGLEVGLGEGTAPDVQYISNTGTTGPPNDNYGDLSKIAGTIDEIRVETQANGAGQIVPIQNLLAGNNLTVYAIARDKVGNYINNVALQNESSWSILSTPGAVSQTALNPSADLKSATLNSQLTGVATIKADSVGLTTITTSGEITILPRPASQLVINTQPPGTGVAGIPFSSATVVELRDQFGNLVTTDSQTNVTASIATGTGPLKGTLTQQASNGIITFNDLRNDIANTITLGIESPGLSSATTNNIVVDHNTASSIKYNVQPSITAQNSTISPAIQVQIIDSLGNDVDTLLAVSINSSILKNSSTKVLNTFSNGSVTFSNLAITNTAPIGPTTLSATFPGISAAVQSETFDIISSSSLAKFSIQSSASAPIDTQAVGTVFGIKITALDGNDNTFTTFTDTVQLTADVSFLVNGSMVSTFTTGNFVSGVLDTTITLAGSGATRLYAENTTVARVGQSNEFFVTPGSYDVTTSSITPASASIEANGNSTTLITVHLKDAYGNVVSAGGETVVLTTTAGSFSGSNSITATDQGNGSYTASLTSGTNAAETASISGTVNSIAINDTAVVDFTPGSIFSLSVSTPDTQVAGTPFGVDIRALDAQGNTVNSFNGNVSLTATNSVITSGGNLTLTNGVNNGHQVTLTKSGSNISLNASADDLFNISGSSTAFTVVAADPSPTFSSVSFAPDIMQNNVSNTSVLTLTLRDQYNNKVLSQQVADFNLQQILLNGNPSTGQPDASTSPLTFNATNSVYTSTLTSSTTIESIEATGYIGTSGSGTPFSVPDTLNIVIPNTWTAGASGPSSAKTNWDNPDNWTAGVPNDGDIVVIPNLTNLPLLNKSLNLGSLTIEAGVSINLLDLNEINVSGNVVIDGIFDLNANTALNIGGNLIGSGTFTASDNSTLQVTGNISVNSFFGRTTGTSLTLNGTQTQEISSPTLIVEDLIIQNDVLVKNTTKLIDLSVLEVTNGFTFELESAGTDTIDVTQEIRGPGTLNINNNTLVIRGDMNISNLEASSGTIIFGNRPANTDYTGLSQQVIQNLSTLNNVTVNNPLGVRTNDDVVVTGDLNLLNGPLIIGSGFSLIAANIIYNQGTVRMRRLINSSPGWRMMAAPLDTSFSDFLDKTVTQGYPNSSLGNAAIDSLQPNVLWYDASYDSTTVNTSQGSTTVPATDNDRWRAPSDANQKVTGGRGYFVYFFGNIANDPNYNTPLPLTLDIEGQQHPTTGSSFSFPSLSYNEVSEGWNLVGNPFTASIDWNDANWVKTNIDNVLYAWDPTTSDYYYWNGIGGGSLDGTKLNNGIIKPFQAFWVKANSANPSMTIDNSVKTTSGSFLGKTNRNPEVITLSLKKDDYTKSTHITFSGDGKTAKDPRDAYRLLPFDTPTYLEFYSTLKDGTELAINNMARDFGTPIEIPLHVGAFENGLALNGTFDIALHQVDDLPSEWTITLIDTERDVEIDLKTEVSYTFIMNQNPQKTAQINTPQDFTLRNKPSLAKSSSNSRFILRIEPGADASGLPDRYQLFNNYPNPFNPSTTFEFSTPLEGPVELTIYDILGRKVEELFSNDVQAGYHRVNWNASNLASGIYIAVFRAGGNQMVKKLSLIK